MSSGIYVLYYEIDDYMYYIGLSTNLNARYRDHCSALIRNAHHNTYLQSTYNRLKVLPTKYILEYTEDKCSSKVLQEKEVYWIEVFDSFHNGANETKGGDNHTFGEDCSYALHNKDTYVNIMKLLANTTLLPVEIGRELNVNPDIVNSIKQGIAHGYLENEFPELYTKMQEKTYDRHKYDKNTYMQIYKDLAYTQLTSKEIALNNNVALSIVKDIRRHSTHKYLKEMLPDAYEAIKNKKDFWYPIVKDPEGNIHEILNMRDFCIKHNLTSSNMHKVVSKERTRHKGWTLA